MKRLIFIIALLHTTISIIAEEFTIGELTFEIISSNEVELVSADSTITTIYITPTVTYQCVKYRITSIGDWAFSS